MDKKGLSHVSMERVQVDGAFAKRLMALVKTSVIPYQWEALNDRLPDTEPSYCLQNFRIAAGLEQGEFHGCVFQDSDVAKWLEAVAYSLVWAPDAQLEQTADEVIDLICAAQQPDGYLDTYYIINGLDKRFTNLKDNHELYCLGHMLEAAVAYFEVTGKDKLLGAMIRYIDYVDSRIGKGEGKIPGYPGHEIIEMALVRLYRITKDPKHLALAKYFVDERGQSPLYFELETQRNQNPFYWKNSAFQYQYYQAGKPVREQHTAEGHAVRAMYLYAGMVDVARLTEDEGLWQACKTLWRDVTRRQMYITGAIGASEYGEAFTYDYDLPNDTIYGETCASIGLAFFAQRMLEVEPRGEYADVVEQTLYNGIISGMSLDGKSFFYVNPLEVIPEASEKDQWHRHVKVQRQKWFACACCPPNLARFVASLPAYVSSVRENTLYVHQYLGGGIEADLEAGKIRLAMRTEYPWEGRIELQVEEAPRGGAVALRIPGWCAQASIQVNGQTMEYGVTDGYAKIQRDWQAGDRIVLTLAMDIQKMQANPKVREDIGKVAVTRGPIVYCLEEADNGMGLHRILLPREAVFSETKEPDTLAGVVTLKSPGLRTTDADWAEDTLYRPARPESREAMVLRWIPYYAWANRNPGEMLVWVREEK